MRAAASARSCRGTPSPANSAMIRARSAVTRSGFESHASKPSVAICASTRCVTVPIAAAVACAQSNATRPDARLQPSLVVRNSWSVTATSTRATGGAMVAAAAWHRHRFRRRPRQERIPPPSHSPVATRCPRAPPATIAQVRSRPRIAPLRGLIVLRRPWGRARRPGATVVLHACKRRTAGALAPPYLRLH